MPIQFRCPACDRRLSIATRKAGTAVACPNCGAPATVPGADTPDPPPEAAPRSFLKPFLVAGLSVLVVGGLVLGALVARKKPAPPAAEQARAEPPKDVPKVPPPADALKPPRDVRPDPVADTPDSPAQTPHLPPQTSAQQPQEPPQAPATQPPPPQSQPQPQPPQPPAPPQPKLPLDKFGNPVGPNLGLARDGEFKGQRILFWCAFENAGRVFFAANSPLWKALADKGFTVTPAFGKFDPAWLANVDQLWIVSSGALQLPLGITPQEYLQFIPLVPELVPSGFTVEEYQFVVGATFDVAFSRRHPLDEKAYRAIEDFVKAGKGLCLLAEDEPFTTEADELARRLFGARVGGNYMGDQVAAVKGRGLTAPEWLKFGVRYQVDEHALLTGVNVVFEGITISNVSASDKLEPALRASDGKTVVAVSKVPGARVVVDCGFTRYCHGPTERTSYLLKTPGTVRLAQNIAAYLAGKGGVK